MGASILLQLFVAKRVDTTAADVRRRRPHRRALSGDRAGGPGLQRQAVDAQRQGGPPADRAVASIEASSRGCEPSVVLELSDRIRRGELDAFV